MSIKKLVAAFFVAFSIASFASILAGCPGTLDLGPFEDGGAAESSSSKASASHSSSSTAKASAAASTGAGVGGMDGGGSGGGDAG